MPENPAQDPVERLARRLLAEAEACPTLISRSESSSGETKRRSKGSFSAMAFLSDPVPDNRQYLEDLVRIAVGSARQAEDMSFEARKANRNTQRSMVVAVTVGILGLIVGIAGFTVGRSARDEPSTLRNMVDDIASQQQQRTAEQAALARQRADRQPLQDALQHEAGTETSKLHQNLEASPPAIPAAQKAPAVELQGGREALQDQIADPPQQATSVQNQVARRSHDLEVASTRTGKLPPQNLEAARAQTEKSIASLQQQRTAEQGTLALQKRHEQTMAVLPPGVLSASPPNLASSATPRVPVFMQGPGASHQLLIAREWLVTGRLDQARRVLAMVQTRMVFQPVEPDKPPAAQGVTALATDVGNAIRWLDMGAKDQAMQALNQAMHNAGAN